MAFNYACGRSHRTPYAVKKSLRLNIGLLSDMIGVGLGVAYDLGSGAPGLAQFRSYLIEFATGCFQRCRRLGLVSKIVIEPLC